MQGARKTRTDLGIVVGLALVVCVIPLANAAMSGPLAKTVAKGKQIFMHDTFGGSGMTCDSCHTGGGLGATVVPGSHNAGPSLSNAAAVFPRYKQDAGRVMTLADEIHGCIRGAIGGKAPAYNSETMRALETYLTSLSQGKRVNMGGKYK